MKNRLIQSWTRDMTKPGGLLDALDTPLDLLKYAYIIAQMEYYSRVDMSEGNSNDIDEIFDLENLSHYGEPEFWDDLTPQHQQILDGFKRLKPEKKKEGKTEVIDLSNDNQKFSSLHQQMLISNLQLESILKSKKTEKKPEVPPTLT